ncbi:hypothetical protein [Acidisarcina polymorpha]
MTPCRPSVTASPRSRCCPTARTRFSFSISMIALRMRATHHDRSAILAAILDGAPRSRPVDANHNHQWEYYGQRTADSAYTPQADKQLESLAKYGKHWARLEARGSQDDNSQRNQQFEPAALSPAPSATTGNSDAALMPPERPMVLRLQN